MKTVARRLRLLVLFLAIVLGLEVFVVVRSAEHLARAREHAAAGRLLEAGREYQTAIGYSAPFNPFCAAAARELRSLAEATAATDPDRAADLEDRLERSVRGTRWLGGFCGASP